VFHTVAWMEGIQNFLALFSWKGVQLAILVDVLFEAAANERLHREFDGRKLSHSLYC
jgi:hypothetical protein